MLALLLVKIIQVICMYLFFYSTEFIIYIFNYSINIIFYLLVYYKIYYLSISSVTFDYWNMKK